MRELKKTSELAIKGILNKVFYKLIKYKNKLKKSILLPEVKSILVIRIGSIGDIIRSTSVIENLSEIYNNTVIDILTSKECKIIYKNNPRIKNIYTLENIDCLDYYDWIINLQYFPPASNFLT